MLAYFSVFIVGCFRLLSGASGLNNGCGKTPQMGFNTWNHYGCSINETLILQCTRAMVSHGLVNIGYKFNDCWAGSRNSTGYIQPELVTFPSGMKAISDFVHSQGIQFGVYSDAGNKTCAGRPGSLGYETQDANSYASWSVDYLKYDNCYNNDLDPRNRYPIMRDALNATGRHLFFSLCDISDNWLSVSQRIDLNQPLWPMAGPGGWNDPDMLEVGNGGMTTDQYKAHFTLWAAMKAPLLIGCDVVNLKSSTKSILSNTEIIAINQDSIGIQAHRVASEGVPIDAQITHHTPFLRYRAVHSLHSLLLATNVIVSPCGKSDTPLTDIGAEFVRATMSARAAKSGRQTWKFANGHIITGYDGRCLTVDDCYTRSDGDNVSVYPCDKIRRSHVPKFASSNHHAGCAHGANQRWIMQANGTITSCLDGQCLTVTPIATSKRLAIYNVQTYPCVIEHDGYVPANQSWDFDATTGTLLSSIAANMCLTVFDTVPPGKNEVWAGPLEDGHIFVAMFNRDSKPHPITAHWADISLNWNQTAYVRDLWLHQDQGIFCNSYSATVSPTSLVALHITPSA